jgi:hypothetical protein
MSRLPLFLLLDVLLALLTLAVGVVAFQGLASTTAPAAAATESGVDPGVQVRNQWTVKHEWDPSTITASFVGVVPSLFLAFFAWVQHRDAEKARMEASLPVIECFVRGDGTGVDLRNIGNSVAKDVAVTVVSSPDGAAGDKTNTQTFGPTETAALAVHAAINVGIGFQSFSAQAKEDISTIDVIVTYKNVYGKEFNARTGFIFRRGNWELYY